MSVDLQIQDTDHIPDPPQPSLDVTPEDSLREVRVVKRWVQIGVYGALLATVPVYTFILAFTGIQLLVIYTISLIIATTAIEGAFAQIFKLKKRSAYPVQLTLQLSGLQLFDLASQNALAILGRLLNLRGSFVALKTNGDGPLNLAAIAGITRIDVERYIRLSAPSIQRAIASAAPVSLHPKRDLLAEVVIPPGHQLVFVPVRSAERTLGALGLLADVSNHDLRDSHLLTTLGLTLGVLLENLRQKDDLRELAAVDELTKVYNRRCFFDHLEREVALALRHSQPLALIMLDFDGLKRINDNFGHVVGDQALRALAQRLVRYSRASDLVARIGGDEFAIILPRTGSRGAQDLVRRLQQSVEKSPLIADDHEIPIAISCGLAAFPQDSNDVEALLRNADAAMYCAKAARRRSSSDE